MSNSENDALSWAGDEDRLSSSAPTKKAREDASASPLSSPEGGVSQSKSMGSIELVSYGILAGIYLLFSIAWLITALSNPTEFADPLGNVMFVFGLWLTVLAPAAWFGAVLLFGRGKSLALRMTFLILGVIVFIPWPYISWAGV